jgi:uncharacterized protein YbjT (DUF2867 family)
MHVVVTGATGLVGRALVRRLLDDGQKVTALTGAVERARPPGRKISVRGH